MGAFYKAVYELVAKIPKGKVVTYGQIAAILGRPMAARAVGEAMRQTPEYLDIPCHRVVKSTGEMAPGYAFGGCDRQRELLLGEGVIFKDNGCVDIKQCLWKE